MACEPITVLRNRDRRDRRKDEQQCSCKG